MELATLNPEQLKAKKLAQAYKVKSSDLNAVQDVDTAKKTVSGVSNMFNWFDSDYDVLIEGASVKSITERGPDTNTAGKIKHALFHDLKRLPGKNTLLQEKSISKGMFGQYFETKMSQSADGIDTLIKYQEGIYDNHSIGFQYMDMEFIDADAKDWKKWLDKLINPEDAEKVGYMFIVKEIKQFEFSTVAFGANSLTPYLGSKSTDRETQVLKLNSKIDAAISFLRSGKGMTDEGFYLLELELQQLKQLQSEAFTIQPDLKSTLLAAGRENETTEKGDTFDLSDAIKKTQFLKF